MDGGMGRSHCTPSPRIPLLPPPPVLPCLSLGLGGSSEPLSSAPGCVGPRTPFPAGVQ